jgi:hypothetical protein
MDLIDWIESPSGQKWFPLIRYAGLFLLLVAAVCMVQHFVTARLSPEELAKDKERPPGIVSLVTVVYEGLKVRVTRHYDTPRGIVGLGLAIAGIVLIIRAFRSGGGDPWWYDRSPSRWGPFGSAYGRTRFWGGWGGWGGWWW